MTYTLLCSHMWSQYIFMKTKFWLLVTKHHSSPIISAIKASATATTEQWLYRSDRNVNWDFNAEICRTIKRSFRNCHVKHSRNTNMVNHAAWNAIEMLFDTFFMVGLSLFKCCWHLDTSHRNFGFIKNVRVAYVRESVFCDFFFHLS